MSSCLVRLVFCDADDAAGDGDAVTGSIFCFLAERGSNCFSGIETAAAATAVEADLEPLLSSFSCSAQILAFAFASSRSCFLETLVAADSGAAGGGGGDSAALRLRGLAMVT